jgi:23S rRNA (pseudouridine1915-N3)-methyltransferase
LMHPKKRSSFKMAIMVLSVGKTVTPFVFDGLVVFLKRMQKYPKISWVELPESKKTKSASVQDRKAAEAEMILNKLTPNSFVVGLDETGSMFSSINFSSKLNDWMSNHADLIFIIGGTYGFHKSVYERMNSTLSLSKMTFTHQMVRLLFMEQLYRAFTILRGDPYHNE